MEDVVVSPSLRAKYGRDYQAGASRWREVGAIGKAQNIVRLCDGIRHERIIDVGAGDGAVLDRLQRAGFAKQAVAVEINEEAAAILRGRGIPNLVDVAVWKNGPLPFPDASFDLAILSHVVEHLEHPRRVLLEAGRVAGHVFVEVPLEDTFRRRGDYRPDPTGHINFYSPRTIRWLLQSTGLDVVREQVTNPPRAQYVFHRRRLGAIDHFVKEVALRLMPRLAPYLTWRYHGALLGRPVGRAKDGASA